MQFSVSWLAWQVHSFESMCSSSHTTQRIAWKCYETRSSRGGAKLQLFSGSSSCVWVCECSTVQSRRWLCSFCIISQPSTSTHGNNCFLIQLFSSSAQPRQQRGRRCWNECTLTKVITYLKVIRKVGVNHPHLSIVRLTKGDFSRWNGKRLQGRANDSLTDWLTQRNNNAFNFCLFYCSPFALYFLKLLFALSYYFTHSGCHSCGVTQSVIVETSFRPPRIQTTQCNILLLYEKLLEYPCIQHVCPKCATTRRRRREMTMHRRCDEKKQKYHYSFSSPSSATNSNKILFEPPGGQ